MRQGSSSHAKSYAEVVSGKYRSGRRNEVSVAIKNNETISVDLSPQPHQGTLNRLESSLVGELKNFDSLRLIGSLKAMEGWAEIRFCYLGGLSLQLDFPSKSNAQDFLHNAESSWRDWFSSLRRWGAEWKPTYRFTMLEVQGLPLHVWNNDTFTKIGGLWGEVVKTECDDNRGFCKTSVLIGILTKKEEWIMDTITIKVLDFCYKIRVAEKLGDDFEIGQIIGESSESQDSSDDSIDNWLDMEEDGSESTTVDKLRNRSSPEVSPEKASSSHDPNRCTSMMQTPPVCSEKDQFSKRRSHAHAKGIIEGGVGMDGPNR